MRSRLAFGALLATLGAVACTLGFDADGLTDGSTLPEGGTGASVPPNRAPPPPTASGDPAEAGADTGTETGGVNLARGGDFEDDCASWSAWKGTRAASSTARSGARSCMFCSTGAEPYEGSGIYQLLSAVSLPVGATVRAEAWVRTAPGSPPLVPGAMFFQDDGIDLQPSDAVVIDDTWRRLVISVIVEQAIDGKLYINIGSLRDNAPVRSNRCLLIDDVAVTRID